MKAGFMHISHEFIHALMKLPSDVRIRGVQFVSQDECKVLLVGDGLPEVVDEALAGKVLAHTHVEPVRWEFEPV